LKLGLITPPVGMNLFIIVSVTERLKFEAAARGVLPFLAADCVRLLLLASIPEPVVVPAAATDEMTGAPGCHTVCPESRQSKKLCVDPRSLL